MRYYIGSWDDKVSSKPDEGEKGYSRYDRYENLSNEEKEPDTKTLLKVIFKLQEKIEKLEESLDQQNKNLLGHIGDINRKY